ncbi:MAG: DUF2071 domain-containing protein [Cytophagaceae bacterium]|nr:DUF2071 domain-containing protein [Gemmatimonadaceae bacterium]
MRTPAPFLTAQWRDLLMLNYEVDPAVLRPLVPAGTTLDLWQGVALVSLVGFRFVDTRVLGVAVPRHREFEEVNLRFYVRREAADGSRRAVVFIRELVPRVAIAWVARALYNEPYRAVPMQHHVARDERGQVLRYEWRERGTWTGLSAHTEGAAEALLPGSEAEFITEHYWGYTRQRDGATVEYRVAHPAWHVWTARDPQLHGAIAATYGGGFAHVFAAPARSAFVAEGSAVIVYRPQRLVVNAR